MQILEEVRQAGEKTALGSGRILAKYFLNRTFALRTGQLRISEFGERIPAMLVTQTNVLTDEITVKTAVILEISLRMRVAEPFGLVTVAFAYYVTHEIKVQLNGSRQFCL